MRKIIFVFVIWCSLPFGMEWKGAFAQKAKRDSLLRLNNRYDKEDIKKLELLNGLADLYQWFQIDTGVVYADRSIALAEKLNNQKQLAIAYNNKATLLYQLVLPEEVEQLLQKALAINMTIGNSDGLAENYLNLSQIKQGDEKRKLNEDALELFAQIGNLDGIARANLFLGNYYIEKDARKALNLYTKSLDEFIKQNNKGWVANAYSAIGGAYMYLADYDSQLYYGTAALKIAIAESNKSVMAGAYTTIGNVYYLRSDYQKILENYLAGLRVSEALNSKLYQSSLLNNLGGMYFELKNYDKSLYYLYKGRDMCTGHKDNLMMSYSFIGNVLLDQKKYTEAEENYQLALELCLETKNLVRIVSFYISLAEVGVLTNDCNKAFANLKKALEANQFDKNHFAGSYYHKIYAKALKISPDEVLKKWGINPASKSKLILENLNKAITKTREAGDNFAEHEVCFELSAAYEAIGIIDSAFYYYKKYSVLKDTILNTDNLNAATNLQLQYETEKKEQQIALLNKDKAIKLTEIESRKTQRNSVLGGLVLVVMIGGVTYNRYRVKQKANKQLSVALTQLKQTQQQLIEQEKMASLGQLTAGIAHEIQNPLNFVINFSELGVTLFDEMESGQTPTEEILADLTENISKIEHHSRRAENIVSGMLLHSRNESTQKQLINLEEICNDAINFAQQTALVKFRKLACEIEKSIAVIPLFDAVYQDIISVVLNLLNNAYHAVNEKQKSNPSYIPKISLSANLQNNMAILKITDNGTGIPNEIKNRIFQPFFTTKNTNEGTGLGLSITNDIVKNHGGEITVQSEPGTYTSFIVALPLS